MTSDKLYNALSITANYLVNNYSESELVVIREELNKILDINIFNNVEYNKKYLYEEIQNILSNVNEKENIRKIKGVYYTPIDTVKFILFNSIKMAYGILDEKNIKVLSLDQIPYKSFVFEKTIFDPTCGAGIFLLTSLEVKLDLLDLHGEEVTRSKINKIIKTLYGNDLNIDSIKITKIRLLLYILNRYGSSKIKGLAEVMDKCFYSYDFISDYTNNIKQFDIVVGNPPYVEDSKCESIPEVKYGNIYANVLDNAINYLLKDGVIGFVIPLSYISTPRMKKIREKLLLNVPEQYILSYSDRPDCLFNSVHQKLCILFGRKKENVKRIYTSNYRYWYREERDKLFCTTEIIENNFVNEYFIPKIGNLVESTIYKKIKSFNTNFLELLNNGNTSIYLNMRAAFWIKAFLQPHNGSEYKEFGCINKDYAKLSMCILNSSLFWWYWVSVSDCWHITRKELSGFKIPEVHDFTVTNMLADKLENMLEKTKVYVGTKQTDYEYKHKNCINVIHEIDDYINSIYELTSDESNYIKQFSFRYRVSGGVLNESN